MKYKKLPHPVFLEEETYRWAPPRRTVQWRVLVGGALMLLVGVVLISLTR